MTDLEFLQYCRTHAGTPRSAFVPQQLARLYELLGDEVSAARWANTPNMIVDGYKYVVLDLLDRIERKVDP